MTFNILSCSIGMYHRLMRYLFWSIITGTYSYILQIAYFLLYTVRNNREAEIMNHGPMIQFFMSILNVVTERDMSNVNFSRI